MVMSLFKVFCEREGIHYNLEVLDLVANHDILETVTGDILYPVKNINDETRRAVEVLEEAAVRLPQNKHLRNYTDEKIKKALNKDQHDMFKACDTLCLWIFCVKEYQMTGQSSIQEVINTCSKLLSNKFASISVFMKTYEV
jgi:5'-deoxynucleotidase YfbR-like HD superfamily hydrolase